MPIPLRGSRAGRNVGGGMLQVAMTALVRELPSMKIQVRGDTNGLSSLENTTAARSSLTCVATPQSTVVCMRTVRGGDPQGEHLCTLYIFPVPPGSLC